MGPCTNPNCHSYGKVHPNCKCHGYSNGGGVDNYCDTKRAHNEDCEYYMADGGWVDVDQANPESDSEWRDLPTHAAAGPEWQDVPEESKPVVGKYDATEQQVKAGLEGAAQGLIGPIAPLIETNLLGVDPKDIKGRAEANPITHGVSEAATLAGGMLYGVGEAGLIAKIAGSAAETSRLGKVGALALKGIIEAASFEGSDEITKAMLSQPGSDPATPVSSALLHVGAAGLMGGITGSVFGLGEKMIGKGLDVLKDKKVIETAQNLLSKLGSEGNPLDKLGITGALKTQIDVATYPLAGIISTKTGIPPGMIMSGIEALVKKRFEWATGKLNNYATNGIIKSLITNEATGIPNAIHYSNNILKGAQKAAKGIDALFKTGSSQIATPASDIAHDELKKFIEGGQVDQQLKNTVGEAPTAYAAGGIVSSPGNSFSNIFQEQNILLNQAKGRISTYLNSIRPLPNQSKLPFDEPNPQTQKKRSYDKAIALAVNPMSVLNHINDGSITPEHVKHFTSLYPEVHSYLSQEMSKRILKSQMNGEKVPYKKRQAMSLFLGANLDSTFTPSAIQTIQGVFAMKKMGQQQQVPQKNKKGTSSLTKMDDHYLTGTQARTQRQQNQKS